MLVTLAIAASVAVASSEWVEISQQHYRKPVRLTHSYPAAQGADHEHPTSHHHPTRGPARIPSHRPQHSNFMPNYDLKEAEHVNQLKDQGQIYSNISISDQIWNSEKHKAPGNVQRININDLKPSPSLPGIHSAGDLLIDTRPASDISNPHKDQTAATIERVPNKGNIVRVQLPNTPVKSPSLNNDIPKINNIRSNSFNNPPTQANEGLRDTFVFGSNVFKDDHEDGSKTSNDVISYRGSDRISPVTNYINYTLTSTTKPSQNTFHRIEFNNSNKIKKSDSKILSSNGESGLNTEIQITQSKLSDIFTTDRNKIDQAAKLVTKIDQAKETEPKEPAFEESTITNLQNSSKSKVPPNTKTESNDEINSQDKNTKKENIKTNSDEVKVNTMENVMKFMKVVTETISNNSKRGGVGGKVKYLNELKDTLLSSIESHIEATWPEEAGRRRSRSTARGHVEFPSSESSLMTISFLTFAVFLIKLVLQVIQTYKNKTMMVAPLVVATAGRAAGSLRTSAFT